MSHTRSTQAPGEQLSAAMRDVVARRAEIKAAEVDKFTFTAALIRARRAVSGRRNVLAEEYMYQKTLVAVVQQEKEEKGEIKAVREQRRQEKADEVWGHSLV